MKILIRNGNVIDPKNSIDCICDVLIEDGKIVKVCENIDEPCDKLIDATNLWVVPGFIDLHVHLRDPGFLHKETIETGAKSAAAGGFTTICAMPNTKPITDNVETVNYILEQAKQKAIVNVLPIGAITIGQKGETLTDFESLKNAGVCGFSEDGRSVSNDELMIEAIKLSKEVNLPIFSHCEDEKLINGGVMNFGKYSKRLGLPGLTNECEDAYTRRDTKMATELDAKLHICHISTQGGVDIVSDARKINKNITAEACPHHFILKDENIDGKSANYKMNPPLRSKHDVAAIINGLKDNVITCIATDHAPHSQDEKDKGFLTAPFGIVGLETAFTLSKRFLYDSGALTKKQLIEKLTINPANVLNLEKGTLSVGSVADVTIIDPDEKYTIATNEFHSKSKNSPFDGFNVVGRVKKTIVSGEVVYDN